MGKDLKRLLLQLDPDSLTPEFSRAEIDLEQAEPARILCRAARTGSELTLNCCRLLIPHVTHPCNRLTDGTLARYQDFTAPSPAHP